MRIAFLWVVLLWGLTSFAQADDAAFRGQFSIVRDGQTITLSLDLFRDRLAGRLLGLPEGDYALAGRREGLAAFGTLTAPTGSRYFALEAKGSGVSLAVIPLNPQGDPILEAGVRYELDRIAAEPLPATTARGTRPAPGAEATVDIVYFLDSFGDWSAADIAGAIAQVEIKRRSLISLFGVLHADLYLSACEGGGTLPPDLQAKQALDCTALLAQAKGLGAQLDRAAMRKAAEAEALALIRLIECDRGMLPKESCADAGVAAAEAVKSWADAGAVLNRFAKSAP